MSAPRIIKPASMRLVRKRTLPLLLFPLTI
jgi:hypothetical protein